MLVISVSLICYPNQKDCVLEKLWHETYHLEVTPRTENEDGSFLVWKKNILGVSLGKYSMNRIPWILGKLKYERPLDDIENKCKLRFKWTLSSYLGWVWQKSRLTRKWPLWTEWWPCQLRGEPKETQEPAVKGTFGPFERLVGRTRVSLIQTSF